MSSSETELSIAASPGGDTISPPKKRFQLKRPLPKVLAEISASASDTRLACIWLDIFVYVLSEEWKYAKYSVDIRYSANLCHT